MEELIKQLAQGGPLAGWVISALLLLGIVYLFNKLLSAKEQHLEDLKKANDVADSIKAAFVPLVSSIESMKTVLEVLKDRTKQS